MQRRIEDFSCLANNAFTEGRPNPLSYFFQWLWRIFLFAKESYDLPPPQIRHSLSETAAATANRKNEFSSQSIPRMYRFRDIQFRFCALYVRVVTLTSCEGSAVSSGLVVIEDQILMCRVKATYRLTI